MIKNPSPPQSVSDDDEWESMPVPSMSGKRNKDPELHFIMCFLKMAKLSSLMVFLKHHYLQYPDSFEITKDGHYTTGEEEPHLTIQYKHPGGIPNMVTGAKHKEWCSTLHVYYRVSSSGKKMFTEITCTTDGQIQVVAICHAE